ncbi:MAG: class I SAM-dependent methyltransferase [Bacteroidales bacterium]|nr:class I SAM-dependent methyltransferase [Bacteroidales bacterium]
MDRFEAFITDNKDADTSRLMFSCREWPRSEDHLLEGIDPRDLAVCTIECRRKLSKKVPEWAALSSLVYPTALCAEQCSSTAAAGLKASIASRIISGTGRRIADLTGGLGVDTWAFSKVASKVLYNEMNPALCQAAGHNFKVLGMDNVTVSSRKAEPGSLDGILGDFEADLIFLDPARRDSAGRKVFLLEDCSPDVLSLVPELFARSRNILLKLSPMADISMVVERLCDASVPCSGHPAGKGRCVREVHVVAWDGECKELLVWMDREYAGSPVTFCWEDGVSMEFDRSAAPAYKGMDSTYARMLFEPGKSFTKAGVVNALGERLGLRKLAGFTHLFVPGEVLSDKELDEKAAELSKYGKVFRIIEMLPLCKASIKELGRKYPRSEVKARNIPMSSDELRSRLKVSSGEDAFIYGVRIEMPADSGNWLIVCRRIILP